MHWYATRGGYNIYWLQYQELELDYLDCAWCVNLLGKERERKRAAGWVPSYIYIYVRKSKLNEKKNYYRTSRLWSIMFKGSWTAPVVCGWFHPFSRDKVLFADNTQWWWVKYSYRRNERVIQTIIRLGVIFRIFTWIFYLVYCGWISIEITFIAKLVISLCHFSIMSN